jgi:hypothetical protein
MRIDNQRPVLAYEGFDLEGHPTLFRLTEEQAIAEQRTHAARHGHTYSDDAEALADFIALNWAWWEA